jgi:hypothetical protein
MRQANRASRRDLAPAKLRQLRMLYDGRVPDVKEAALAEQAERLTDRFLRHYHHAVPFDRGLVEAAWLRCRGDDCEDRQREAWRNLSSLDGQSPILSESAAPSERERAAPSLDAEEDDASQEDDPFFERVETK